jgi:hypothetical protein
VKTKPKTLEAKLDKIFSEYVRLEQADDKGMCICVSCGIMKYWQDIDAGHFYSRQHRSVRWDEMNVHPECRYCNRFNIDHHIGYFKFMLDRYGVYKMQELTDRKNTAKKWTREELQELIDIYTERVKQLKREKGL